jgi:hypothetical protein
MKTKKNRGMRKNTYKLVKREWEEKKKSWDKEESEEDEWIYGDLDLESILFLCRIIYSYISYEIVCICMRLIKPIN